MELKLGTYMEERDRIKSSPTLERYSDHIPVKITIEEGRTIQFYDDEDVEIMKMQPEELVALYGAYMSCVKLWNIDRNDK